MKRLTLILLGCIQAVILVELVYRWDTFGRPFNLGSVRPLGQSGALTASAVPDVPFALQPDLDIVHKLVAVRTNSDGLRDARYDREKPAETFRIGVVGDSFTMPAGVRIEDAWHSLLEIDLNRFREGRVELINFAVGGYGMRQYSALAGRAVIDWQCDAVIVGYCPANDHLDLPERAYRRTYRPLPAETGFRWFSWERARRVVKGKSEKYGLQSLAGPADLTREQEGYIRHHLAKLSFLEVPVIVAYLGIERNGQYESWLAQKCDNAGLIYVSCQLPAFTPTSYWWINRADAHPNPAAHRFFANRLHPFISELISSRPVRPSLPESFRDTSSTTGRTAGSF